MLRLCLGVCLAGPCALTPTGSWRAGTARLECVSAFILSRWNQFHTERTQRSKTVPKAEKTGTNASVADSPSRVLGLGCLATRSEA